MAPQTLHWAFAVSRETDSRVRQAATVAHQSLDDFVVAAAVAEAESVLADRRHFVLAADEWARFVEVLDRPPQVKPELRRLFATPTSFTAG